MVSGVVPGQPPVPVVSKISPGGRLRNRRPVVRSIPEAPSRYMRAPLPPVAAGTVKGTMAWPLMETLFGIRCVPPLV